MLGMFVTQVFVRPDIDRNDFEQHFMNQFEGGTFKFYDLVPDAHNGDKMYELFVPNSRKKEVLPWFREYWNQRSYDTTIHQASGFGFSHSG